jgi:hypothetical protein
MSGSNLPFVMNTYTRVINVVEELFHVTWIRRNEGCAQAPYR